MYQLRNIKPIKNQFFSTKVLDMERASKSRLVLKPRQKIVDTGCTVSAHLYSFNKNWKSIDLWKLDSRKSLSRVRTFALYWELGRSVIHYSTVNCCWTLQKDPLYMKVSHRVEDTMKYTCCIYILYIYIGYFKRSVHRRMYVYTYLSEIHNWIRNWVGKFKKRYYSVKK